MIRAAAAIAFTIEAGWELLVAESALVALGIARDGDPDAILVDVVMPEMDGREFVRRLRADPRTRDIPIVVMTASGALDRTELDALGIRGLIAKPFDIGTVAEELARLLAGEPSSGPSAEDDAAPAAPRPASAAEPARLSAPLQAVWNETAPTIAARVELLAHAAAAHAAGDLDEAQRVEARRAAHMLAGTLGMFGFADATETCRSLERALDEKPDGAPELEHLVQALRRQLDG